MQEGSTTILSTPSRSLPPFITTTSVPQPPPASSSSPSLNSSNTKLGLSTLPSFSSSSLHPSGSVMPSSEGEIEALESEMSEQDLSFETEDGSGNGSHQAPTQDLASSANPTSLADGTSSNPIVVVRDLEQEESDRKEVVRKVMKRVYLAKVSFINCVCVEEHRNRSRFFFQVRDEGVFWTA